MEKQGKTLRGKPGVQLRELLSVDSDGKEKLVGYVLVTDDGQVVGTYTNLDDANKAFDDWDDEPPPPTTTITPPSFGM